MSGVILMKRVMASALTLALILGAVGCGEKKNDSATIIGGADGPTSIYLAPSAGSDKISENQNDDGRKPELIIKFYMQGMGGHADTLGYVLMHLTLNSDGTWNQEKAEFVLDK